MRSILIDQQSNGRNTYEAFRPILHIHYLAGGAFAGPGFPGAWFFAGFGFP